MRNRLLLPLVLLSLAANRPGASTGKDTVTDADGNQLTLAQVAAASTQKAGKEIHTLHVDGALTLKDPRNAKDPCVVAVYSILELDKAEDAAGQSLLAPAAKAPPKSGRKTWLPRTERPMPLKSSELRLSASADRIDKWVLVARGVRAVKEETLEVPASAAAGWTKAGEGLSVRVKEAKVDKRNKGTLKVEYKRDGEGVAGGAFIHRVDWLNANGIAIGGNTWTGGEGPLSREGVFQSDAPISVKPGEGADVGKLRLTVVTKAEEVDMKFEVEGGVGK